MQAIGDTLKFVVGDGIPHEEAEAGCEFASGHWLPVVGRGGLLDAVEEPGGGEDSGKCGSECGIVVHALGSVGAVGADQILMFVGGEWTTPCF